MSVSPKIVTRRARSSGFSLVEVLIAFGVGGIVFVTLYAGLARGFSAVDSAHQHLRGTQILTEKLEVIRLYSWSQINTPGFIPATFTEYYHTSTNGGASTLGIAYRGTITVTNAAVQTPYTNTMRRVIAQVSWVRGGVTNRERMETFVSQYGVQNFIY
jgi:Tfp pilus assembly protein PilV